MAILSKAGITSGSVIQPAHVTQIIDALTASGSVIDISVTGSFRVAGTTQLGVLGTSTQSPLVFNPDTSGESVFYIKNPSGALTIGTGGNPYAGSDFITLSSLGVLGLNGNLTVNNTASIGSVFVSGKTGLGTTNPQARLVISNNGSQSIEMDYSVGLDANYIESYNRSSSAPLDLVYYIGSGPTGSHRFFTNGNQRMVVSRDGYVGIGTATPTAPLNVSGDTVITGSTTLFNNGGTLDLRGVNHSYIQWYPDNSTREAYFGFPSSGSQNVVLENENASGGITLKANNGIGINTFTPNATLDVNGDTIISGTLNVTNGITGSLLGIASTASFIAPAIINNTDNGILTATGGGLIESEQNLTFNGSTLNVNGNTIMTGSLINRITTTPSRTNPNIRLDYSSSTASPQNNQSIGVIGAFTPFFGQYGPYIRFVSQGNWSGGVYPAGIEFYTQQSSGGNERLALTLRENGNVQVNSGSLSVTGSVTISDVLTLPPVSPLPSGRPTGSLAVSGSGANCKVYFFNGSWNALF